MKKIAKIILIICLLVGAGSASAHQPYFVDKADRVAVPEPEVSKAYYGILPGEPVKFVISTTTPFDLYVGLLVPDLSNATTGISAYVIYQDGTIVAKLVGDNFVWTKWHEEFAGDDYLKGPEFSLKTAPAGIYTVVVYSSHNWDRYVVAIGETESFPVSKLFATEQQIYSVKTQFFGKPWTAIFEGKIGGYKLYGLATVGVLLIGILWFWRRKRGKKL